MSEKIQEAENVFIVLTPGRDLNTTSISKQETNERW